MLANTEVMRERPYQRLIVWKEAHALCVEIYKITAAFPKHELFGLTSQMCRSSSSVPTNIAEGHAKHSRKEFLRFLDIALGSLEELDYQLFLSNDLSYITNLKHEELHGKAQRVGYLMAKLRASVL